MLAIIIPKDLYPQINNLRDLYYRTEWSRQKVNKNSLWLKIRPTGIWLLTLLRINPSSPKYTPLQKKLEHSGLSRKYSMEDVLAIKWLSSLASFLYLGFLAFPNGTLMNYFLLTTLPIGLFWLPDSWLNIHVAKRKKQIEREMPSLLNTLAVMTDSGLNLLPAIKELGLRNAGELTEEFRKTLDDIRLGTPQVEAFFEMGNRCEVPDLNLFISALAQNLEKGSSGVSRTIREQAQAVWIKRKQRSLVLGQKASFKLFLPMLLLVFPALLIFLIAPAVLSAVKFF